MTLYRPRDRLLKVEFYWICFVNSPAEAVAKYFDEYVWVSVCPRGYLRNTRMIFTKFVVHVAYVHGWSSSGMLMIGRITYLREGGDSSAQHGQSVIYDCLVCFWNDGYLWPGLHWEGIWVSQSKSTSSSPYSKLWTLPFLWSPYLIGQTIIFSSCFFLLLLLSFFCSPNLSSRRLDVYHTSAHGVVLV